jgi:hypothetical protein
MKRVTTYLLLATALLALATCTQPDPLPEATQGGKQTFGCRVNGKPFVPDGGTGWNATKPIVLYSSWRKGEDGSVYKYYIIHAISRDGRGMFIIISDAYKTGHRSLDKEYIPITWSDLPNDAAVYSEGKDHFFTSPRHTGSVFISKTDSIRGIISGTFTFIAANPATGEVVEVTDGRFDVKAE